MTDAERLRLLELEEEEAQEQARAQPAPAVAGEEPGRAEALGRGAVQGATFGFGDEVWGASRAIGEALPESLGGGRGKLSLSSLLESYRRNRDENRSGNKAADMAHGGYYLGGNIAGGLAIPAGALGGAAKAGKGLLAAMKAGGIAGAKMGAATGFGMSDSDLTEGEAGGAALDTAIGALGGGVLGGVLPAVGAGAKKGAELLRLLRKGGYVVPTAEAERLTAEGVDLTLGQMQPDSFFGRVEEMAAKSAVGSSVSTAREKSASSARDVLLRKAGAPGAKAPTAGAQVGQQIDELAAGYGQVYDAALDGQKLQPDQYLGQGKWRGLLTDENLVGAAKTKGAFELAAMDKGIDASPAIRKRALAWLTNEAQRLAPTKTGANAGTVDARSIQALRTSLRDKIRNLGSDGDDRQLGEIYGRAQEFVSELLEGQLPPKSADALRGADASYKSLLAARDAAKAAFVQNEEFTPGQLLMAIRRKGATPQMESAARDAHSVLNATYPPTGLQGAAIQSVPGLKWTGPAWASFANSSPRLRAHALGQGSLWPAISVPAAATQGIAHGVEAMSRDRSRDALIRALMLQKQDLGPPMIASSD